MTRKIIHLTISNGDLMKKRPEVLQGKTHKIRVEGCASLYATLNREEGELRELMLNIGKKGTCQNTCFYAIGVLFSIIFELGVSTDKLLKTIKKHFIDIRCECGNSCFDKLGRIILDELQKEEEKK